MRQRPEGVTKGPERPWQRVGGRTATSQWAVPRWVHHRLAAKTVQKSCTARNANGVNGTAASTLPDGQRAGQRGDVLGELLGQVWQFRKCPNGTVFDAEQYLTSTGIASKIALRHLSFLVSFSLSPSPSPVTSTVALPAPSLPCHI